MRSPDREREPKGRANPDLDRLLTQQLSSLRRQRELKRILLRFFCAVLAVFLLTNFIISFVVIHGDAMSPSLRSGDVGLVWKLQRHYDTGDIVLFETGAASSIQVARVIAGPGDEVEIDDTRGVVLVNGEMLTEAYIYTFTSVADLPYPVTLGKDEYFLLGDNRNQSMDSRYTNIGTVSRNEMIGRIIFLFRRC